MGGSLRIASIWVTVVVLLLGAACSGPPEPAPTGEPVGLPPTRTPSLAAQPTAMPTDTPAPTPEPTSTPVPPTPTAAPPLPTETPLPEGTAEPVQVTPIAGLQAGMEEVTVEGRVAGTDSFRDGFKFILDDTTGQVVLLMWLSVYDDCWDAPGLNIGALVRVTGAVTEYQGELEIQPEWGGAVQVLEPAAPWAEPRDIGSITPADEGQRVMVEGTVARTEGVGEVYIADGTGEILLFIWGNVLDRIPNNAGLGTPGTPVRAVGLVTVYEGTLEIIPTLPHDVVVGP